MRRFSLAMVGIAMAALVTMVSCRKPNVNNVVPAAPRTVTFNAMTESNGGSKTTLEGLDVKWSADDQISVNGNDANHKLTLKYGAGTTFGSFTGTITATVPYLVGYPATATNDGTNITFTIPSEQSGNDASLTGVLPMAVYTTDENVDLSFKNMVNVLKLDLTGTQSLTKIEVESATENLSGNFMVGAGLTPSVINTGTTSKKITITKNMMLTGTPLTVYVVLPVFSAESPVTLTFTGAAGLQTLSGTLTGSTTPNHLYNASVEVSLVAPLYLSGDFTVNSGGDKVKFSRGNLYYEPSTNSFKMEENQWGYQPSNSGTWSSTHISHFFWSNTASVAYAQSHSDPSATTSDVFFTEASGFTVEGQTGWRTLSYDEWRYLIGKSSPGRSTSLRAYSAVTFGVSGPTVNGLILMPDDCLAFITTNPLGATTDYATWQVLASKGAVFLPAAGHRFGTDVYDVGSNGIYWSSTPYEYDDNYLYHAYIMGLNSGDVGYDLRAGGHSVRLVR